MLHCVNDNCDYFKEYGECSSVCENNGFKKIVTNFDKIKAMTVEEMARFLKSMVDENETHEVACYGCINYNTHHSDPQYKGTNLYECEGCSCEGIGHNLVAWLESEVSE